MPAGAEAQPSWVGYGARAVHPITPQKSGEAKAEDWESNVSTSNAEEGPQEEHSSEEERRPKKRRHLEDLKEVMTSGKESSLPSSAGFKAAHAHIYDMFRQWPCLLFF